MKITAPHELKGHFQDNRPCGLAPLHERMKISCIRHCEPFDYAHGKLREAIPASSILSSDGDLLRPLASQSSALLASSTIEDENKLV